MYSGISRHHWSVCIPVSKTFIALEESSSHWQSTNHFSSVVGVEPGQLAKTTRKHIQLIELGVVTMNHIIVLAWFQAGYIS